MDDLNRLIVMSQQMGFMNNLFEKNVANSTKCTTWKQVTESHMVRNQDAGFRLKDLGGIMLVLAVGLGAALIIFFAEKMVNRYKNLWNEVVTF